MEKKIYEKPAMQLEEFVSNDCIAACGDSGTTYYDFVCDAPINGNHYSQGAYWDDVYWWSQSQFNPLDPNTNTKRLEDYTGQTAQYLTMYHPCNQTHKVSTTSRFYYGFIDRDNNGKYTEGEGVVIWRERLSLMRYDTHCTQQLSHEDWTIAKS